jgi:hypothetical protein
MMAPTRLAARHSGWLDGGNVAWGARRGGVGEAVGVAVGVAVGTSVAAGAVGAAVGIVAVSAAAMDIGVGVGDAVAVLPHPATTNAISAAAMILPWPLRRGRGRGPVVVMRSPVTVQWVIVATGHRLERAGSAHATGSAAAGT